jgi:branched-chain amino acid transport system ATP-binding protein
MLLQIDDLKVKYGTIEVLHGINLSVREGEVVTILGTNGAGKSTTLLAISGLVKPSGGSILFDGKPIHRLKAHEIVKFGITQAPEGRRIFDTLTVDENLTLGGYIARDRARDDETRQSVFRLFPILKERRRQLGGTLSGGEQQMLAIGRALMAHPRLLLLDEPSLGLAPLLVKTIFDTLREISRRGVTIILVEQNARAALKLAVRGYVMEVGNIVLEDTAAALLHNPHVQSAYLGG